MKILAIELLVVGWFLFWMITIFYFASRFWFGFPLRIFFIVLSAGFITRYILLVYTIINFDFIFNFTVVSPVFLIVL